MASPTKTTSVIISTLLGVSAMAFNLAASAQPSPEDLRENAQQERRGNPPSSTNRPAAQNQQQTPGQRPASTPSRNQQATPQPKHQAGQKATPA